MKGSENFMDKKWEDIYVEEMSKKKFSREQKYELLDKMKQNDFAKNYHMKTRVNKRMIVLGVCVSVLLGVLTIGAVGKWTIQPELLRGLWMNNDSEIAALQERGIATDVTSVSNGVTITSEGIVGDAHMLIGTFKVKYEQDMKDMFMMENNELKIMGFRHIEDEIVNNGSTALNFYDEKKEDNEFTFSMFQLSDEEISNKILELSLRDFSYCDEQGEIHTLLEGEWHFTIPLDYEDSSVKIAEKGEFSWNGFEMKIKEISVSELGIYISFTTDSNVFITDIRNIPVIVTMSTGEVLDYTGRYEKGLGKYGIFSNKVKGHCIVPFEKLTEIEEIESILIGDTEFMM